MVGFRRGWHGRVGRGAAVVATAVGLLSATGCFATVGDFNNDGFADLRYAKVDPTTSPSTEAWYDHPNGTTPVMPLHGQSAFGDFDNDGRYEMAEVHPSTGMWFTTGARGTFSFPRPDFTSPRPGATGWLAQAYNHVFPVPGRYVAGQGTKAAWFDDATATWTIEGQSPVQFGTPDDGIAPNDHDIPAPADYDGDGVTELAVYHPNTGIVDIQGLPSVTTVPFQMPVPGDYDGDGVDEVGTWGFVQNGAGGFGFTISGQPPVVFPGITGDNNFPFVGNVNNGPGDEAAVFVHPNIVRIQQADGSIVSTQLAAGTTVAAPYLLDINQVFFLGHHVFRNH